MTRMDTVRAATGNTKESVRHAAEVMAPYAGTARDTAVQYAHEAGARLGPKVSHAARQARTSARDGYDHVVVPRIAKARKNLPPELDRAATKAAKRTRRAARKATDYAAPRIEHAVADARSASGPVREEAASRSAAAFAALRGQVSAKEIEKLVRKRDKRARRGRLARRLGLL
ncbi:transcriptional regulator, partial [Streptomyces nanshensis]